MISGDFKALLARSLARSFADPTVVQLYSCHQNQSLANWNISQAPRGLFPTINNLFPDGFKGSWLPISFVIVVPILHGIITTKLRYRYIDTTLACSCYVGS